MAALDAKNRFGALLDAAQREPVTIEKHGRPVAVVLSAEDYGELEAQRLEQLRAGLRKGLEDFDRGRTIDGTRAFRDAHKRLRAHKRRRP